MQSEFDLWDHCKCNLNLTNERIANAILIQQMGAQQSEFDRWVLGAVNFYKTLFFILLNDNIVEPKYFIYLQTWRS